MVNLWNWIATHWQTWVVSGVSGVIGGFVGATFKWFYPSRKEWEESRKTKQEAKIDAKVLGKMRDLCESTSAIYGTRDIAKRLMMTIDETADSLERLEIVGRVQSYDIGTSDDPGPGWRSKFR